MTDSLDREAAVRDIAKRAHTAIVERQRACDAVEVPGLSLAALAVLQDLQKARLSTEQTPGQGEDAWQRRRDQAVAYVWIKGRSVTRVANELDTFMGAAERRLGEAGVWAALNAEGNGGRPILPGVGGEHQAGLDEVARLFRLGYDGRTLSDAWGRRVQREAKETRKVGQVRVGLKEREYPALTKEPEQDRELQRPTREAGRRR